MPNVLFMHHFSNMIEQYRYVSAVLHIHLLQITRQQEKRNSSNGWVSNYRNDVASQPFHGK